MHTLEIYSAPSSRDKARSFADYKIGNIRLAKHLGINDDFSAIEVDRDYAKQLLLRMPSCLASGRVPLYLCGCCADLGCGAVTVKVEDLGGRIKWSDIGWESNWKQGFSQNNWMKRTSPFYFDKTAYISALRGYSMRK
ncbi:hypothetical protein [Hahella sp. NBU794]|uniref:hypothetical protein n=1 Tax=Hahella sp. NBU794 TaxID=3422590 RepID=UPI003D6EF589